MDVARITSKGQMTIPMRVRQAAQLAAGDVVSFAVSGGEVTMHKLVPGSDEYLRAVQGTLGEWNSPEDEEAWRGL
jgi:antitoxin PrlF